MNMPDYAAIYKILFQSQTKAIEILQEAQQDAEEIYINTLEPSLIISEHKEPEDGQDNQE